MFHLSRSAVYRTLHRLYWDGTIQQPYEYMCHEYTVYSRSSRNNTYQLPRLSILARRPGLAPLRTTMSPLVVTVLIHKGLRMIILQDSRHALCQQTYLDLKDESFMSVGCQSLLFLRRQASYHPEKCR